MERKFKFKLKTSNFSNKTPTNSNLNETIPSPKQEIKLFTGHKIIKDSSNNQQFKFNKNSIDSKLKSTSLCKVLSKDEFDHDWQQGLKQKESEKENFGSQKPVATVKPIMKQLNKPDLILDDKTKCPSCSREYTSKSSDRRLVDECGHASCFTCITKQIKCKLCNIQYNKIDNDDDGDIDFAKIDEIIKQVTNRKENSVNNVEKSPILVSSISKLSPEVVEINKKITGEDENEFKKAKKVTINDKIEEIVLEEYNTDDDDDCVIDECDFDTIEVKQKEKEIEDHLIHNGVYIPKIENYEKINWLFKDIKDSSDQFRLLNYEHTNEMLKKFRNSFGLKSFRPQQFEAVNAALLGLNVFILMPTGGGKSLCYQLPAVISKGVTFVVSPLKSLIIDQVQKLNALGLNACHMLSDVDSSDFDQIYQELVKQESKYKLVYITPEKLNNSNKLRNVILNLYNRGMISRLVIDEAHCVSQWGHDFRTDYKKMGELRSTLMPNVPCMLLTATATPRVRNDILMQMKLIISEESSYTSGNENRLESKLSNRVYLPLIPSSNQLPHNNQKCVFFMQSFNRENLQYKVEYKTSNSAALEKICELIKSRFQNKSGIVYCISRNECEQVSEYLKKNGIRALPYHAGMDDKTRHDTQYKWTNSNECKVVCATIAFGMGIDKPDVGFVIHLSLPKSLEGFYQESGRAGRDGRKALCLLFYNNQDRQKWLRIISAEYNNRNPSAYETHVENIRRIAQYCDNRIDCRRAQILEYFGEIFDRRKCIQSKMNTICDNCELFEEKKSRIIDVTDKALIIIKGVQKICHNEDFTIPHLADILKGFQNSKIIEKCHNSLDIHSKLSDLKKNDIERLIRRLIFMGYLKEELKILKHSDTIASYIRLGPNAFKILNNSTIKIQFELIDDSKKKNELKNTQVISIRDSDDSDIEEIVNENETIKTCKKKTNSELSEILTRCKIELNRLIKSIGTEKNLENINTIFTKKMTKEMLNLLPTTKEELLGVTGFTEAIFDKYKGDEFLKLFQHYSNLKSKCSNVTDKKQGLSLNKNIGNIELNNKKWLNSKEKPVSKRKNSNNSNTALKKI